MKDMKRGKAAGLDGITIEMLRAADDVTVKHITDIANKVYNPGQIPKHMSRQCLLPYRKLLALWTVGNIGH